MNSARRLLDGFITVVAGGSSGIGRGVVQRFAQEGSIVEFAGIGNDEVRAAESALRTEGLEVHGEAVDLSEECSVEAYFEMIRRRHGRVTAIVNSVGIQRYGTVESTSVETWDEVFRVNVRSMFLTAKYGVPLLRSNGGGAIVLVSSGQAYASQQNVAAYTASKGAIVALTRAMAVDLAQENIRVNSVTPGSVDTPMLLESARRINATEPEEVVKEWGRLHPIGRVGRPEEIADAILFLVSSMASFVTGADLRVDGGVLASVAIAAPQDESP